MSHATEDPVGLLDAHRLKKHWLLSRVVARCNQNASPGTLDLRRHAALRTKDPGRVGPSTTKHFTWASDAQISQD